jgi:hypothetical protein
MTGCPAEIVLLLFVKHRYNLCNNANAPLLSHCEVFLPQFPRVPLFIARPLTTDSEET